MIEVKSITTEKYGVHDITGDVKEIIAQSKIKNGIVTVETPHAGTGIVATAVGDALLKQDIMDELRRLVPSRITFKHEDSPDATAGHVKSALFGTSVTAIIQNGKFISEQELAYYLCEYDGPRNRQFYVSIIADK